MLNTDEAMVRQNLINVENLRSKLSEAQGSYEKLITSAQDRDVYERFKQAAEDMDKLPRVARDVFPVTVAGPDRSLTRLDPDVELQELLLALSEVLRRADMFESHHVSKERLSTRERMAQVLDTLAHQHFVPFVSLFKAEEGRLGVVVTFLAVMELIKESLVEIVQSESFAPIHVKARTQ